MLCGWVQELLEVCGRSHSLYDVYKALEAVHSAAPPSWSLDLISGLPHLNEDTWRKSLECALDAGPPHISIYDLQVMPFASCSSPSSKFPAQLFRLI